MTTDRRRKKRPHAATGARILTAGASVSAAVVMAAAMAGSAGTGDSAGTGGSAAPSAATDPAPQGLQRQPGVVIRRSTGAATVAPAPPVSRSSAPPVTASRAS